MEHYRYSMSRSDSPFGSLTSHKHLAMALALLFLRAVLSYLFGILILSSGVSPYMQSFRIAVPYPRGDELSSKLSRYRHHQRR